MLQVLLAVAMLWALIATVLVIRNPLPFPDRGHRLFGVPNDKARRVVLDILKGADMAPRFRFQTGPSDQTLLWDNMTVIHVLDQAGGQTGNGISVVVQNPELAAQQAMQILAASGFQAERLPPEVASGLPTGELVVLSSTAFSGWALAFRRHQLKMTKPTFLPPQ